MILQELVYIYKYGSPIFGQTDCEHSLNVPVLDPCTKDFHHALGPIVECEPWESHATRNSL